MIRFTQQDLDAILAEFLGKPWERYATGPDAYDCYGLTRAFMDRVGIEIADIGKVDPMDSRPIYEREQTDYIRLTWPRPWSLVTFSGSDLNAHIGVVLPGENLFLHCPGRAAGKVLAEPLSRRPWRDRIDGYWWPKGYIETVVLLTPMTTTKRAWQFVRAGRSLAEIIEQDITEGRDVPVQVFLDGELIEKDNWLSVVPTELQQIVVRPLMGEGEQALMMAGMVALAIFAPYAAGAIAGTTSAAVAAGTATAGQIFAYNLAAASVMMAGGLALNALIGANEADRESSQHYTWDPQTTQRVGSLVPLVYGTYGVRGNILCAYATSEYTYETNVFTKAQQIRHATELYHTKIAYSDGPIEGVIDGTEKINDRDPNYYSDSAHFTVEHFTGTNDQTASSIADAFEVPVGLDCPTNQPATTTFTAVDCDAAALVLRFPNGFTNYEKDGGHKSTNVTIKAEIRVAGGAWHPLMNGNLYGDSRDPMRINLNLAGSYTGGTPFTLVAGTRYEAKITRLNSTHSDRGDSFVFDCVQFQYNTAQKLPGIAYTAIGAAASREISGSIQYYAKIKGKLVRVYDSTTQTWSIQWSDNPAWIAYDLLTRPVIKGNGTTRPYEVEYYQRLDPSYLVLANFVAFAAWCDQWVPDGNGGTEKRYVFNGIFDADGSAWDQAIRVCKMACAMPYFRGHRVGIVVDKPGTPCQMFNVSNLRSGFAETWIDNSEAATVYDVEFADEMADYATESYPVPLLGAARDIPASLDGFGHTRRSQVWRRASRQLRINQHMRRTVEIPACLDAIWSSIGDIVYVQHPALQRASGGRIAEVYADGVKLDKRPDLGTYDTGCNPSGSQHNTSGFGIRLFVKAPLRLGSCKVVAIASGNITVKVHRYLAGTGITGDVMAEKTFAVVAGANELTLDFGLDTNTPGENYLLYSANVFSLQRTDTDQTWAHYDFANIAIVGGANTLASVQNNRWYYFFNLTVTNPVTSHALLVRTHDTAAERLNLYTVSSVSGANSDIVTISGTWEYTPSANDLWTFGQEAKVIDLYRIKSFERTRDGQMLIQGAQYTTDYYDDDDQAPRIQSQVYSTNKGGKSPTLLPTTAEAIKAALPDGNSELDSLIWEGLAFTGNGSTTVTWTCSSTGGAGIKYRGVWCPIFDEAVGTTDRYIYFDPNVGDPRYLQHTSNLADLAGQERYVFCVNQAGVAYFKPGLLVTADEVKLDGVEEGADVTANNPISTFRENFEDPQGDYVTRWGVIGQENSIQSGGLAGGKFLRAGNNSGEDRVNLLYYRKIPYDPDKLYRMKMRVRVPAGTGRLYAGIYGYDSAGATLNPDGASAHWICAVNRLPNPDWTTYTCYFKGHSASGSTGETPTVAAPGSLKTGVAYFTIRAFLNYSGSPSIMEVDEIAIDILPESADVIAESTTRKWAGETGADVTGDHAGDINYTGTTPPAHKAGRLWRNTNWCGQDCVGHWRMNDNAANKVVKDESPYGNHGTAQQNTSALTVAGKVGKGLTFNGTSDCIAMPGSPASLNVGMGDFSLTIWIKTAALTTQRLIAKRNVGNGRGLDLYLYSDGRIGMYIKDAADAYVSKLITPASSVRDDAWHFIGISIDRDGNSYFYVDGTLSSAQSFAAAAGNLDVADDLLVGTYAGGSYFSGAMDNTALFKRALTGNDFDALYDAGTGTEQFGLGSTRALMRSDGTYWLLATSDSPTIPRTADEIGESTDRKWAGETGADITHNSNIATGLFIETFEDPQNNVTTRWSRNDTSVAMSIETTGLAGGKCLRIGNASSVSVTYLRYNVSFPFDPARLYRLRVRARHISGTIKLYAGVSGRDGTDTVYVNRTGANDATFGAHLVGPYNQTVPAEWTTYTAYFKGTAATGSADAHYSSPASPAALHQNVRYIRPLLFVYSATGGVLDIDEFVIDVMPDGGAVSTDAIAPGSVVNYGAAYTDDFAMLNTASGEVDMQSLSITTTGLPVVIQYGATVQYGNGASSAALRLYRVGAGDPLQTSTIIKAEIGDDKGYFSAFIHTPTAGTHTYKFTSTGGANYVLVGKRFLSVTEFKR